MPMLPRHQLAPFKRRLAAKVVDALLAFGCAFSTELVISVTGASSWWALVGIFAAIAYLFLGDAMNGQSLGKRLFDLQVVDFRHGYPCTLWQSAIRNAAGFGWLRIFQLAEESEAIDAGTFTGQVVIDTRPLSASRPDLKPSQGNLAASQPAAKIDFEGIGEFVRRKK